MRFTVVETEAAYNRLLKAADAAEREAVFREELVAPFAGLVQVFGGDALGAFGSWGMSPEHFAPERRAPMVAILEALETANAWNRATWALERGRAAFAAYGDRIPLEHSVFGLCVAERGSDPQARGYLGFGGVPGWIMTIYKAPDAYYLKRVEAAAVHELHHNIMGSVTTSNLMTVTVGEYMIGEGLAESFAAELYGEEVVGPWIAEFDEATLEASKALVQGVLDVGGYDTARRYVFGDPEGGIPHAAGYALGYRIVQAYLKRTGQRVVEATFVPPVELIEASGFFG